MIEKNLLKKFILLSLSLWMLPLAGDRPVCDHHGMHSRIHAVVLPSEVADFADEVRRIFLELETLDRAQLHNFLRAPVHKKEEDDESKLWHYYGDGRTYHDVIVQLSNDANFSTGVSTVFNNDMNNTSGQGIGTDRPQPFTDHRDGPFAVRVDEREGTPLWLVAKGRLHP